jgi:hypothetical protein
MEISAKSKKKTTKLERRKMAYHCQDLDELFAVETA